MATSRSIVSGRPVDAEFSLLFLEGVRLDKHFESRFSESLIFRLQLRIKRLFDIVGSAILLVLFLPVLAAALLAVLLSSPGPPIFSQLRWGYRQRQFRCLKIRTMFVGREAKQSQEDRSRGVLLKQKNDSRVTRVGALLRKTSVDELPQLINVLRGEMSLVGPRPLMMHMLEPFEAIREVRCVMRPGITGLWQIRNRAYNTSVMEMIADDAEYIGRYNLLLDFKVLMATFGELINAEGAY